MPLGITALPTPPSRADPTNFAARGDALLSALPQLVDEINAIGAAMGLVGPTVTTITPIFAGVQVGNGVASTEAGFLLQGTVTTSLNPKYGFVDALDTVMSGSDGARAQASFADSRILRGAENHDHMHSFQSFHNFTGSAVLANMRSFFSHSNIDGAGSVTTRTGLDVQDARGTGDVDNQIGVRIAALTRGGVTNKAIVTEGTTPSTFGGAVTTGALQVNGSIAGTTTLTLTGKIRTGGVSEIDANYNAEFVKSGATSGAAVLKNDAGSGGFTALVHNAATTGNNSFVAFGTEASFTSRGSIDYDRGGGVVRYNTTSDRRSKTAIGPIADAIDRLLRLNPIRARMSGAAYDIDAFIADEAQLVVPQAVSGRPGLVDMSLRPIMQGVDHGAMVPLIVAALQQIAHEVRALQHA